MHKIGKTKPISGILILTQCTVLKGFVFAVDKTYTCAHKFCPRRQSILLLRTSLAVGFCVSALWAALTVCAADVVAWSATLSLVNAAHAVRLAVQFLPPRLSPELLELYERLFGPLKVEKQHFKVPNPPPAIENDNHKINLINISCLAS